MKNRSDARPFGEDSVRAELGAAIRKARLPRTQEELAVRLSCPQSSISTWENGKVGISVDQVCRIEAALGLSAGALLIEAGCVDLAPHTRDLVPSGGRPCRWRAPAGTGSDFPSQVAAWMAEFSPIIDAIGVLRSSGLDDHALRVLLASPPVRQLTLSWELWEALDASGATEEQLVRVIGWAQVGSCRWALWGDAAWSAPTPADAVSLRLVR